MAKDSGTRSGLLWEVERILSECEERPQVLLMENVPEVIGEKNIKHFADWIKRLDEWGYKSKWCVMNATEFGVPQNRKRCFMVSVLGDYFYTFPTPTRCTLRLKDILEPKVDEKYYLSNETLKRIASWNAQQDPLKDIEKEKAISPCITARGAGEEHSGMILINEDAIQVVGNYSPKDRVYSTESVAMCHCASIPQGSYNYLENERIRKLTPKECFRLMGVSDADFDKIAKNQSDSSLYHLAGDSIVTNCLMAIFKEML